MNIDWRKVLGAAVVVVIAAGIWGANSKPTPGPATTTTTSTTSTTSSTSTTTTALSPTSGDICELLDQAQPESTIVLNQATAPPLELHPVTKNPGGGCDTHPEAAGVTVTGTWTGDVRCHVCNGWTFSKVTVTAGSLRMIGGHSWSIIDSTMDGAGRGLNTIVGTGSTDAIEGPDANPHDWLIARSTFAHPGCKPADSKAANQAHALYVIGINGQAMNGVIEDSTFIHDGCGAAVKLGATGSFGSWVGAADAADVVTFRRNTVVNTAPGVEASGVLISGHSDDITIDGNVIETRQEAMRPSGPFSGARLRITGNQIRAPTFLLGRRWVRPELAAFGTQLAGETTQRITAPGPCPQWGTCTGNT